MDKIKLFFKNKKNKEYKKLDHENQKELNLIFLEILQNINERILDNKKIDKIDFLSDLLPEVKSRKIYKDIKEKKNTQLFLFEKEIESLINNIEYYKIINKPIDFKNLAGYDFSSFLEIFIFKNDEDEVKLRIEKKGREMKVHKEIKVGEMTEEIVMYILTAKKT